MKLRRRDMTRRASMREGRERLHLGGLASTKSPRVHIWPWRLQFDEFQSRRCVGLFDGSEAIRCGFRESGAKFLRPEKLRRPRHHPDSDLAVGAELRLGGADARSPVASQRGQGLVRPGIETATNSKREVGRVLLDLAPGGHRIIVVHGWRGRRPRCPWSPIRYR